MTEREPCALAMQRVSPPDPWRTILVSLILAMGLAVTGCGSGGSASSAPAAAPAVGSIQLVVAREASRDARTVPAGTTAIRVSIVGTAISTTASFPAGSSTVTVTLSGVPVGVQTVLVEALNGSQILASGQSTVTVQADQSASLTITLTPATLALTSVSPPGGPAAGATVTITGTNFATSGTVTVKFGTSPATNVAVRSSTAVTCTSPPSAAGVVDVTVTNPDQTSATLAGAYAYYVDTPVIMTVTGTGVAGFSGDGGPASTAQINFPWDLQVDSSGNLIIVDTHNYRLRKIDGATGLIATIAGTGMASATGDGGPATAATVNPAAMALGPGGDIYVMDAGNGSQRLLRKISATTGTITLVKNLTPTSTKLLGFVLDRSGNAYLSQWYGPAAVFKLDPLGVVTTVNTGLSALRSVALSPDESQLYASNQNGFDISTEGHKVKRIPLASGTLADFAGTGTQSFSGDGGPALAATLNTPWFVCTDTSGNVFICDRGNNRIRKVDGVTGIISTVVGDGVSVTPAMATSPRGDGGPPLNAQIGPLAAVCAWNGDLYFSEVDSNKVRRVTTAPNPTGISPQSGPVGTTVTLTGTNFRPGCAITFGGVPATDVQVTGLTQAVCTVPSVVGVAMPLAVAAQNQGTQRSVLARAFTVVP